MMDVDRSSPSQSQRVIKNVCEEAGEALSAKEAAQGGHLPCALFDSLCVCALDPPFSLLPLTGGLGRMTSRKDRCDCFGRCVEILSISSELERYSTFHRDPPTGMRG